MKFTVDEIVRCPTKKKAQKRKRDDGKAEVEKKGTIVLEEAPAFLEGIVEGVLGVPTIELKASLPTKEMEVATPTSMDTEVARAALVVA